MKPEKLPGQRKFKIAFWLAVAFFSAAFYGWFGAYAVAFFLGCVFTALAIAIANASSKDAGEEQEQEPEA